MPVIAALLVSLAAAPLAQAATKSARGPLLWTAPGGIDLRPLDAIACPSSRLCVAVDRSGTLFWSHDPAGEPGKWHSREVDGIHEITSVSCPSTRLCVAVDAPGDVIAWQSPGGAESSVAITRIDTTKTQNNTDNAGSILLRGVSCPTTSLCVAVDAAGNALVSLDPTGGSATWTMTHIDNNRTDNCTGSGLTCQPPLTGVSCPSAQLCAAVDFSGNLLTTSEPAAPTAWTSTQTDGGGLSSLYGISCPASGFCATVDGDARRAITVNPATPTAQSSRLLPDSLYGIWCQSRTLCLASAETAGGVSALLGSFDPAAPKSIWSLSTLGGVNGVACPTASLCIAVDDAGNVAAGETTTEIAAALEHELVHPGRLPSSGAIARAKQAQLKFTSLIAAKVTLTWTATGVGGAPAELASGSHRFTAPGTARITLRLFPAGQRLFRAARGQVAVSAKATFVASTGALSVVKQLTLSR